MRRFIPLLILIVAFTAYENRARLFPVVSSADSTGAASSRPGLAPFSPGNVEIANPAKPALARTGKINRGASFFVAMQQAGVAPGDIHEIVQASKGFFNFKRVRPGQQFTLFGENEASPDSVHYVIDEEKVLRIARGEDGFATRLDTIPYRIEHFVTSGTIENSIYEALLAQGADPELASHMAVIFQWDIDFFKDLRRGDTFTLLYEMKTYDNGKEQLGNVLAARVRTQGREHHAVAYRGNDGILNYYDLAGGSLQKSLLRAPLRYQRISSNFSHRRLHPVTKSYRPHLGVDYVAPRGTPVRATGDGVVVAATFERANGNYVKIRHNGRYTTFYLHLQGFAKGIRSGVRVRQGEVIGYLGGTGLVTAPHLDYRIKLDGRFVNPRTVRLPSKEPVPGSERESFTIVRDACLVRLFEATHRGHTVLVEKPAPPMQSRLSGVF